MKPDQSSIERLRFLMRVTRRESKYLEVTDGRLFGRPFTSQRAARLGEDVAEAECAEAFVGRFGRLQDTLGDKLLSFYLEAVGEPVGAMLDNLDLGERLGLIASADEWFAMRKLRNQMVHEYIEDPMILASALQSGHEFVPVLLRTARGFGEVVSGRGWLT